jgi:hypothetical protein
MKMLVVQIHHHSDGSELSEIQDLVTGRGLLFIPCESPSDSGAQKVLQLL